MVHDGSGEDTPTQSFHETMQPDIQSLKEFCHFS